MHRVVRWGSRLLAVALLIGAVTWLRMASTPPEVLWLRDGGGGPSSWLVSYSPSLDTPCIWKIRGAGHAGPSGAARDRAVRLVEDAGWIGAFREAIGQTPGDGIARGYSETGTTAVVEGTVWFELKRDLRWEDGW